MTTTDEQTPGGRTKSVSAAAAGEKPRLGRRALGLILLGLSIGILLRLFVLELLVVPTTSMYPALEPGDRVLVEKITPLFGSINPGDVVVIDNPLFVEDEDEEESTLMQVLKPVIRLLAPGRASEKDPLLIKRVVATAGQTVEARLGVLFVDGVRQIEEYRDQGILMRDYGPVTVPEGKVFVLGDKRNFSTDSRTFGSIPVETVHGKAVVRVWPLLEIGVI